MSGKHFYVPVQVPVQLVDEVYAFIAARLGTELNVEGFDPIEDEPETPVATTPIRRMSPRCSVKNRHGERCTRKARHSNRHRYVQPTDGTVANHDYIVEL